MKTIVLGDSHTKVFTRMNQNHGTKIDVTLVHGASLMGLSNQHSHTKAREIYNKELMHLFQPCNIIIQLGDVDVSRVIWKRAERNGETIGQQIDEVSNRLVGFIKKINPAHKVYYLVPFLPAVDDNVDKKLIYPARRDVKASLQERTDALKQLTKKIKHLSTKHNFTVIDINSDLVDTRTGKLHDFYRDSNPGEHHLNNTRVAPTLRKSLCSMGLV